MICVCVEELGLADGQELAVADVTTPQTVLFKLNFTSETRSIKQVQN